VASFSGGEPLLYDPLREILEHAHQIGMRTTVTSNGMLLDDRRLEMLKGAADLLAISLDGLPASHNRLRSSGQAFEVMASRLEGVRASGIPFGFIFTLTRHNIHELQWVASFAREQGARLLQIHPLEEVGRAAEFLSGSRPDAASSVYALVEGLRIQSASPGDLYIQVDLFDRDVLRANPDLVFAGETGGEAARSVLADLISPLIIESDGTMVPLQHGFARDYALGNLSQQSLKDAAAGWRDKVLPQFRDLCRRVFQDATVPQPLPFFNWYEAIFQKARALAAGSHCGGAR
jgi:MoaA/NifB/PqqE/SkfB family radical SAM enzyme